MRLAIACLLLAACGGPAASQPPDHRRPAAAAPPPVDAAVAEAAWPDAGVPDDPVVYPDAGLRELGSAQCDLLFARLLTCPGIGAEQKEEMARAQADLRREAADPGRREAVAAACRQMTEAMEETLRRLAC